MPKKKSKRANVIGKKLDSIDGAIKEEDLDEAWRIILGKKTGESFADLAQGFSETGFHYQASKMYGLGCSQRLQVIGNGLEYLRDLYNARQEAGLVQVIGNAELKGKLEKRGYRVENYRGYEAPRTMSVLTKKDEAYYREVFREREKMLDRVSDGILNIQPRLVILNLNERINDPEYLELYPFLKPEGIILYNKMKQRAEQMQLPLPKILGYSMSASWTGIWRRATGQDSATEYNLYDVIDAKLGIKKPNKG